MPLVYQQDVHPYIRLAVWKIEEPLEFFAVEGIAAKEISHPHKKKQHVAGRYLLRVLEKDFPVKKILIAPSSKPYIDGEENFFSISHCGDYVAAAIHKSREIGVDVEKPLDKILKIAQKFINPPEQRLIDHVPTEQVFMITLIWSIKEAVFKWHGEGGVDFIKHIQVTDIIKIKKGWEVDIIFSKHNPVKLKGSAILIEGQICCWVTV